jgi:hypothetical protein
VRSASVCILTKDIGTPEARDETSHVSAQPRVYSNELYFDADASDAFGRSSIDRNEVEPDGSRSSLIFFSQGNDSYEEPIFALRNAASTFALFFDSERMGRNLVNSERTRDATFCKILVSLLFLFVNARKKEISALRCLSHKL